MKLRSRAALSALATVVMVLALAATASAAAPTATTRAATEISSGGATLVGSVDPNNEATSYYFEYGTTRNFGSRTELQNAGTGANARRVTTRVEGLTPATQYFFRIVASNRSGVQNGGRLAFRTLRQPLGVQIGVVPNPVLFGEAITVTGTVTGTGSARRQVVLQQRPFPYTSSFTNVGSPTVADDAGAFSIDVVPGPLLNTQYQVSTLGNNPATSGIITVGVAPKITTKRTRRSVERNRRMTLYGRMTPGRRGTPFQIQKQTTSGRWMVVARGVTTKGRSGYGRWKKRIKVTRTARYRVFIDIRGDYVGGIGREVTVRVRR